MKTSINKSITIHWNLSIEEATFIRGLLQNPHSDAPSDIQSIRERLFDELDSALDEAGV